MTYQRIQPGLTLPAPRTRRPGRVAPAALPSRRGLTLIELLVSIAILVTVLAGVIPVLSPNNDARRLRSGAQQLQSMLVQAQAQAARDGRAYGIAFQEGGAVDTNNDGTPDVGNGAAIQAFFISEPAPYTGFSRYSAARMMVGQDPDPAVQNYHELWLRVQFVLRGTTTGNAEPNDMVEDPFPPNLIRRGDFIQLEGVTYRIIDADQDGDGTDESHTEFVDGDYYTQNTLKSTLLVERIGEGPPLSKNKDFPTVFYTAAKPYKIIRQASSIIGRPGNTSATPLQLPRGVGIDMIASGVDARIPLPPDLPSYGFTTLQSENQAKYAFGLTYKSKAKPWPTFTRPITVGVMFAPSGRLEGIYVNGEKLQGVPERLYLLVGRLENSVRTLEEQGADADFKNVSNDEEGDEELAARRSRLNWLNGDSLWVTVGASGRVTTANNDISADPRYLATFTNPPATPDVQTARQINRARALAREMTGGGR